VLSKSKYIIPKTPNRNKNCTHSNGTFFDNLNLDAGELNFWHYYIVVGILYPRTVKSYWMISHINVELVSDVSGTICVSIIRGWCDECCVCMLCLYTELSSVPTQMVWGMMSSQIVMPCPYAAFIGNTQLVIWIHVACYWSFQVWQPTNCSTWGPGWDKISLNTQPHPLLPTQSEQGQTVALCINIVCKHNTQHIGPWWRKQRLSLSHQAPIPHWHGWLLKTTILYTVAKKRTIIINIINSP
jgi:hypothetical protein